MNKNLCFCIENKKLYLEQTLVEYMDIPIFYLCKNEHQYYVVLCIDIEELNYIIVQTSYSDIYNLLHAKCPMRDIILKQHEYWQVITGEEISSDIVTKHCINELDISVMPKEKACFEILTEEMKEFVRKFDNDFFNMEYFNDSKKKADFNEMAMDNPLDIIVENFTNLGEYSIKTPLLQKKGSEVVLYDYCATCISKVKIKVRNTNKAEQWKTNELINIAV